jgi:glycine oxidase
VDPLYHELPEILVALDEREVEERMETMRWVTQHGIVARWLDRDEVFAAEPLIGGDVLGAACEDGVGQVDSYRLTLAFAAAAEKRRATVRQREAVGLERKGSRVTGVITPNERIPCDRVVLAMGAWSRPASEWTGFPVPVKPFKGQTLRLRYPGTPPKSFIGYVGRGGVVPRRDGTLSFGSSFEDADDSEPTEEFKLDTLSGALPVMPWLEEAEVVHHLAGPRPVSPDDLPIIGPVPGWDGLYLSTGHGRHGIQLAAITGKLVADLIVRGATSEPVPMEAYLPDRFAEYTPEPEG